MKGRFKTVGERVIRNFTIKFSLIFLPVLLILAIIFFAIPDILLLKIIFGVYLGLWGITGFVIIYSVEKTAHQEATQKLEFIHKSKDNSKTFEMDSEGVPKRVTFAISRKSYFDFIYGRKYSCFKERDYERVKELMKMQFFEFNKAIVNIVIEEGHIDTSKLVYHTLINDVYYFV